MEISRGVVILLSLLVFVKMSSASVVDFCVADFQFPVGPAGYPCKNPTNVTVDDFVFSGLGVAGNTSSTFKASVTAAFDSTLPGLNGLGISMVRLDIGVGGVIALHTHRVSELVMVIDGPIIGGFIAGDTTAYVKTLNKGDIMVFPATLLHFQVNIGDSPALAFGSFNSANPGFQVTTTSISANNIPSDVIEKITLLDDYQVMKLKQIFGGTN